jgi:hypothetical protein
LRKVTSALKIASFADTVILFFSSLDFKRFTNEDGFIGFKLFVLELLTEARLAKSSLGLEMVVQKTL